MTQGEDRFEYNLELVKMLQRENPERQVIITNGEFLETQIKRLTLQIAGCALMGYSGCQLVGIYTPKLLKVVIARSKKLMQELNSFASWSNTWRDFHHGVSMGSPPHNYYMYFCFSLLPKQLQDS